MPINSRRKGANAELEVAKIIFDELGIKVERNLDQWRSGGFDLSGLPGWAIEVKRSKKLTLPAWWRQTLEQARAADMKPVLWYRIDRQPWKVVVPLGILARGIESSWSLEYTAELTPQGFACLYREMYLID